MKFDLLSSLWLHEPDSAAVARAMSELGLPTATPDELAAAYADLFLLNVYPYGTAYTDPEGELNAPEAHELAALYKTQGYCPPELNEVAAPDHLGLCLGFLSHVSSLRAVEEPALTRSVSKGGEAISSQRLLRGFAPRNDHLISGLLEWIPICCLAVERDPAAHRFYRALAALTRKSLMAETLIPNTQYPIHHSSFIIHHSEVTLRDLVRFFLAPAQCGLFLSRSRLGHIANELGLSLPFSSRFEVAEALFASAGAEHIERLIDKLSEEVKCWTAEYRSWAEAYPAWSPVAGVWQARTAQSQRTLSEMRATIAAAAA